METYNSNQAPQGQSESGINIKDILLGCLEKWYWFVISIAICLAIGIFSILRTTPVYQRNSTILVKEQLSRRTSANDLDMMLSSVGTGGTSSRLVNEVIAFRSPALMQEVVTRLGLDTEYSVDGRFHSTVIYGERVPVSVEFCGNPGDVSADFVLTPQDEGFTLSKLAYYDRDLRKKVKVKGVTTHAFGDTVSVGIASIVVFPSELYNGSWTVPVHVTRRTMYATTRKFSSKLSAEQVDAKNRSDVLDLKISDVNIQRADDILSMLMNVYNENWVSDKNKMAISTTMFINDRLQVIEKELGNVDESISEFKSKNLIPDVSSVSNMYMTRSSETVRKIQEIENNLYVTKYVRNYLTNNDDCTQLIPMASSVSNNGISTQITGYNNMVLRRNSIVSNSSDANPLAVTMEESINATRKAILESMDSEIATLEAQLVMLKQEDDKNTQKIAASPSQAKYLLSVERQQKVKESLYLYLLQKREENELSQAFTAYNTRLISPPGGSSVPTAPRSRQVLMIALLIGLMIPVVIVYLLTAMNTKVRGRQDLEFLTIPFLGEVPQYVSPEEKKLRKNIFHRLRFWKKPEEKSLVVVKDGKRDIINEAFRVLRTNIEFMSRKSEGPVVTVLTSYNPGSGKTFLCMNTAVTLAIKGLKVLCIDGDLRHASLSEFVNSPKSGLSDYLAGRTDDLKSLIVRHSERRHLDILPIGTVPPNPSELLADPRFEQVIATAREQYDYIFIDCPPVDIVADTQIIQEFADKTIFVVRTKLLERSMLVELQRLYDEKKYKNLCYILNGTDAGEGRYASRYSYHRGYYGSNADPAGYYGSTEEG